MKTLKILALVLAAVMLLGAAEAFAASTTANLDINAAVSSRAKLTLGQATIHFVDADPDNTSSIAATENGVTVGVKARTASAASVTLQVSSAADLASGSDSIAISNITWTAAGTGFVGGTMNKSAAQSAGSWTGRVNQNGTFSYFLANSWNYAPGTYTATVTYTLTAP